MKRCVFFLFLFLLPVFVKAEQGWETVSTVEKYYKTIIVNGIEFSSEEITEEEYNLVDPSISTVGVINTDYKRMTSSILSNGSYYRYKVVLDWKNMPATRSYDIIAIGYSAQVIPVSTCYFVQDYCDVSGCNSTYSFTESVFSNGISAVFKLPSDSGLISLSQTFYFDVMKSGSDIIMSQVIAGDYSHATSSISKVNALKHTVISSEIVLNSSVVSYYDSISSAVTSWTGSW